MGIYMFEFEPISIETELLLFFSRCSITLEHAEEIAAFCARFGREYRGSTLCAAVSAVMEKLLNPMRENT